MHHQLMHMLTHILRLLLQCHCQSASFIPSLHMPVYSQRAYACQCLPQLGPTPDTTRRKRTHAPSPTLAAPVLNHTPFAQRSAAQHAGHRMRARWPLPPHGTGDPRTALQPRGPCRPFSRLAMDYGGMDRLSGDPPLHLGWVRRGARQSGEAHTHARGQRR